MCFRCVTGIGVNADAAHRLHVLDLLALIEHADALPCDAALRVGRELLAILDLHPDRFQCHPVTPGGATGEDP